MEHIGLGAGLAALAFWGFVAVAVLAGVWNGIRKRDAQHETVRRLIESGQTIDQELLEKLALVSGDENRRPDREFHITGLWVLPVAVGMAIFALILGQAEPDALFPLLGVSALLACLGIGWLVAAKIVARWYAANGDSQA
ncbi:MAG: DUF6249 domain-containing protein [Gammaproteobacteria bacterium]|nr:DUF6249 domain-containing protein [Gammaproteobacteria bacterium]